MIGWENPLGIISGAAETFIGSVVLFFATCWSATLLALWLHGVPPHVNPWLHILPIAWLISVIWSLFDGWGFLAYGIIALFTFALSSANRKSNCFFAIFVVQFIETTRFFISATPVRSCRR